MLSTLGSGFASALVRLQSDEDVLAARSLGVALTRSGVRAYAEHHPKATALSCAEAIEVASKSKAEQLAIAIRGGASFATVAEKNSLDASASRGGSLGCVTPYALTSPLGSIVAALPVGALSAPIQFSGEWILFEVTSRRASTLSEAAATIVHLGMSAASKALDGDVDKARVEVDPHYGTWTKVDGVYEVKSPAGPPLRLLPNPSAVGA